MKRTDETLSLSQTELAEKLNELQAEYENLLLQKATHQLNNPMRIRLVRRDIARVKTMQTEFANGIRKETTEAK